MNFTNLIDTWANLDISNNYSDASYNSMTTNNIRNYIDHLLNMSSSSHPEEYPGLIGNNSLNNIIEPNSSGSSYVDDAYGSFLENILLTNINPDIHLRTLLTESLMETNKFKQVLSKEGQETIKNEKYTCEKYKDQKCCPISQKKFEEGDDISVLPCNHIFNPDLIKKWLENENASCPICRFKMKSKEIKMDPSSCHVDNIISEPTPLRRTFRRSPYNTGGYLRRSMHELLVRRERRQEEADIQTALMASLETYSEEFDTNSLDDVD